MIRIDEAMLRYRKFSGQIIFCYDNGVRQHVMVQETGHPKDPELADKLLRHGIHCSADGLPDRRVAGADSHPGATS